MKKVILTIMSLTLFILTSCGTETPKEPNYAEPSPSQSVKNEILSSFSATDISGTEVDETVLDDYDLTMVNVWATFCSPCIREMPDLGELAAEYKDKGVQIVGLISESNITTFKKKAREEN